MDKLRIGDFEISPGEQRKIDLPVAKLYTDASVSRSLKLLKVQ